MNRDLLCSRMLRTGALGLFVLLVSVSCTRRSQEGPDAYLVVVSLDGFRWDYADRAHTPNLDRLAMQGVRASAMIPSFPSKTFPNHYTLATGLVPDHHGIINNNFYAEELGGIYRIGDQDMVTNGKAYLGEPIWVTAEKQGVRTGCYYWVGSEAEIQGVRPTYWNAYDESVPYGDRVTQVLDWLRLPVAQRPGLVMLYFDEPDGTGHEFGPDAEQTREKVEMLDSIVGQLMEGIRNLEFGDKVNLIVLSDHGMGPTSPERYVNLLDHVGEGLMDDVVGGNPVYLLDAAEGMEDSLAQVLDRVEGISAWTEDQIPAGLSFGTSPRFPDVLVVADNLWSVGTRKEPGRYSGGTHGYDPAYSAMHTIFYADGPAFRDGYVQAPFVNVEVYGIMTHVLGLEAAPYDGDLAHVEGMFSESH